MARGLIITSHFVLNSSSSSISRFSSQAKYKYTNIPPLSSSNHLHFSPSTRCFCCGCQYPQTDPIELSKYRETFFKRMTVSGLKPHHRIAMGVSGGPDSMALCVLAADWKTNGLNAATKQSSEFIDGLLAIVVDHGLRIESKDEANLVRRRVLNMDARLLVVNGLMVSPNRVTCKKQLVQRGIKIFRGFVLNTRLAHYYWHIMQMTRFGTNPCFCSMWV